MATQHRARASVFTMLEKIDQAARHTYSPRGYQISGFQRAYLIYKLGGRAAADIAHRSSGTPSIDATKRHILTAPPPIFFKFSDSRRTSVQPFYLLSTLPTRPRFG